MQNKAIKVVIRMSKKRGINLSFETIVVATIVLIVMIVVIMFFTGAFKNITGDLKNVNSCKAKQGNWDCYKEKKNDQQCIPLGCEAETKWCCGSE